MKADRNASKYEQPTTPEVTLDRAGMRRSEIFPKAATLYLNMYSRLRLRDINRTVVL